jgi:hypothetical protein
LRRRIVLDGSAARSVRSVAVMYVSRGLLIAIVVISSPMWLALLGLVTNWTWLFMPLLWLMRLFGG